MQDGHNPLSPLNRPPKTFIQRLAKQTRDGLKRDVPDEEIDDRALPVRTKSCVAKTQKQIEHQRDLNHQPKKQHLRRDEWE